MPGLNNLLWYRNFKRNNLSSFVKALRSGPLPLKKGATAKHEKMLGISPACAYFYLGRLEPSFGDAAIAVAQDAFEGDVSPFDSGGLIAQIAPVASWEDDSRRAYLQAFTWDAEDLPDLLARYPTSDPGRLNQYTRGARPEHAGPHELWDDRPSADIWTLNSAPRTWTWEGRCPRQDLPLRIVRWSCAPDRYQELVAYATTSPDDTEWIAKLLPLYVEGGAGMLLKQARDKA